MFTVTSMEFRDMGDTLRLRSHASISAEVTLSAARLTAGIF